MAGGSVEKMSSSISISRVNRVYTDTDGNTVNALADVSLDIKAGEFISIIGPSGCGKTTLLRLIAGLDKPQSGELSIDERAIKDVSTERGYVFQQGGLFPWLTVEKNIAYGLKARGVFKRDRSKVSDYISLVGLDGFESAYPHQISGGMAQRVAIARALINEPKALLLDEPMGALDKKLREQMRLELVDIINSVGVTCLMVTHDQEEAMTMADRIAIMDRGEFVQVGGPREIYENPNCRFSAEFIGSVNMFDCTLVSSNTTQSIISCKDFPHPIELAHDLDLADGMSLSIALRPEKIYISSQQPEEQTNWCEGDVENIAYLGDISIYYVRLRDGRIISSTLPNVDRFKTGLPTWDDHVYLSWDPESCIALTI